MLITTGDDAAETGTAGMRADDCVAVAVYRPVGRDEAGRIACQAPDGSAVAATRVDWPAEDARVVVTLAPGYAVPLTFAPTATPDGVASTGGARTENVGDTTSGREVFVISRTVRVSPSPLATRTPHDQTPSVPTAVVQREDAGCAGSRTRSDAPGSPVPRAVVRPVDESATWMVGAWAGGSEGVATGVDPESAWGAAGAVAAAASAESRGRAVPTTASPPASSSTAAAPRRRRARRPVPGTAGRRWPPGAAACRGLGVVLVSTVTQLRRSSGYKSIHLATDVERWK